MRISTQYQFNSYMNNIHDSNQQYLMYQNQLSTGKRWTSASEDPIAASQSLGQRSLKSRIEQYNKNLERATDYLGNSDNALSEVSTLTQQAYTLAIQGASDTVDQATRESIASQVEDLRTRLADLGNSTGSNGQYIFGGHLTDAKPFKDSGGTLSYSGDNGPIFVEIRSGERMQANFSNADQLFGDIYDQLTSLASNLRSGNVQVISDQNIGQLKSLVNNVSSVRGSIGSKMQEVQSQKTANQRRIDDLTTGISNLEDIDLSEVYVKYSSAQVAYQASLQVASQGMGLSLMNYLR